MYYTRSIPNGDPVKWRPPTALPRSLSRSSAAARATSPTISIHRFSSFIIKRIVDTISIKIYRPSLNPEIRKYSYEFRKKIQILDIVEKNREIIYEFHARWVIFFFFDRCNEKESKSRSPIKKRRRRRLAIAEPRARYSPRALYYNQMYKGIHG